MSLSKLVAKIRNIGKLKGRPSNLKYEVLRRLEEKQADIKTGDASVTAALGESKSRYVHPTVGSHAIWILTT
jgi:hypothetical protein